MENKFIVTPKADKSVTMTIRIDPKINTVLEELSLKSGRSRNELINKALRYAIENMQFEDNSNE